MHKKAVFITLALLLVTSSLPVHAQSHKATITLLSNRGQETTSIMDGNAVRLSIKLVEAVITDADVSFFLDGSKKSVATCALAKGTVSCQTEPVYALGWYWSEKGSQLPKRTITVTVGGLEAEGTLEIEVTPRPVVMVHGFMSNWETWQKYLGRNGYLASIGLQGFAVGDGQVPGLLNTGHMDKPRERTNTVAQNAEILGKYIAAVQKETGAEKVDLLVHSMGGMISRYYVDRVMSTDNVAQVIFLGTPMAGSSCVYPLAALGYMTPASLEIQPAYMINIFNKQIIHRQGLAFHMLAGTLLTEPLTSPCTATPSDTVVALESATFIPLDNVKRIPIYHGDLTGDPVIFENGVRQLLQLPPGSFEPRPDPLESIPDPGTEEQFSRAYTGHLAKGQSAKVTIQIDPNVRLASFNLFDSSRSLEIEVQGANGNAIQLDAQKNGMLKLDDPDTMIYLGYGFPQPRPGAWVVTIKTTGKTPSQGADYAINARFLGGARLEASTDQTILGLGKSVTVNAMLIGDGLNVEIESANAVIRKPDGNTETLELSINGDQYSLTYKPTTRGLYSIEVNAIGKTSDGILIDRATNLSFEVETGQAQVSRNFKFWMSMVALSLFIVALIIVLSLKQYIKNLK